MLASEREETESTKEDCRYDENGAEEEDDDIDADYVPERNQERERKTVVQKIKKETLDLSQHADFKVQRSKSS